MCHSWKHVSHTEKFTTLRNMRHTCKKYAAHLKENALELKKFATLAKKAAELVKCATLGKMLNVWQNAPHLKNAPNMEKWATLRKVPHT